MAGIMRRMMNIQELRSIAQDFRCAIKSLPVNERTDVGLDLFPGGACGAATDLLGGYLISLGEDPFYHMVGYKGDASHAWLQRDGLIIDITADQFDDMPEEVIVSYDSPWHSRLEVFEDDAWTIREFEPTDRSAAGRFYRKLLGILDR